MLFVVGYVRDIWYTSVNMLHLVALFIICLVFQSDLNLAQQSSGQAH